jgi:hypothetical protein
MVKRKPRTQISVADGAGGMMPVEDRRFERGDWPISFDIPVAQEQSERWSRYLSWECNRRGWSPSQLSQVDRAENSGTIVITASGKPKLDIVWERKRGGPLKVRARLAASSDLSPAEAEQFFGDVNDHCRSAVTVPVYARGTLQYEGRAWRGELWLDNNTRLAPPSLQDETAIHGPRIVHVDAVLESIGEPDVTYARQEMLIEVSAFLSVAMRCAVRLPEYGRTWVVTADMRGCEVRSLGYLEPVNPLSLPSRGTIKKVPLRALDTPPGGIPENEVSLRDDVVELWGLYRKLGAEQRLQFLQAAAKWQEAMIHWQDRPSLSFALMAVSCEALKPSDADERRNCHDVIQALLGKTAVDRIRQNPFPAQHVRSTHLHSGELHGSELIMMDFMRTYEDPSFRDAHRGMADVTPAVIIEWLKRRGTVNLPNIKKRRTIRRWARDNLVIAFGLVFAVGLLIGWFLRVFRA